MIRRIDMAAQMPLPLLITGIAGVPGYNAMAYFSAKYPGQVVGIRQADNVRLLGPAWFPATPKTAAVWPGSSRNIGSPRCSTPPATTP